MNDKLSKELLSAYLDGEIAPLEEAELLRQLKISADAQRELADYRRISEFIQELPVDSAPPEFRSAVLQAAERQMLLPSGDPPDRASRSRVGRGGRRWLVTGGLLASAAMLFLAVRLFNSTGPASGDRSQNVALRNAPAASASPAEAVRLNRFERQADSRDDTRRTVESEAAFSGNSGAVRERAKSFDEAGRTAPRAPAITMNAATSAKDKRTVSGYVAKTKTRRARTVAGGGAGLVFGSNLKNARVGQSVKALERSGNRVAVITLTVVDRRAGVDDLQILLARHQIPKASRQPREVKAAQHWQKKSQRDLKKKESPTGLARKSAARVLSAPARALADPGQGNLVAVYVEATPEQMAGVLRELQHRKRFVGLNIGRPIAVAQLDAVSHARVADRNREQDGLSRLVKDASGGKREAAAAKSPRGEKKKKTSRKTALRKRNSVADAARPSRQLRLALPADAFKARYRRHSVADRPDAAAVASDSKRKKRMLADKELPAKSAKGNRLAGKSSAPKHRSSRPRSVRVLFVLMTVTDPEKPGHAPTRPRPASATPAPRKPASRRPPDGMPG